MKKIMTITIMSALLLGVACKKLDAKISKTRYTKDKKFYLKTSNSKIDLISRRNHKIIGSHKIDSNFDYVILGHTHTERIEHYKNGIYANLGTWLDKPLYGIYENGKFDLREWK